MPEVICGFQKEFRFLSNFWPAEVVANGIIVPTVEHGYQLSKTLDPDEQRIIAWSRGPGGAKKLGQFVTYRPDWEEIKVDIMRGLVLQKFSHPGLREQLLATGNRELIEGNDWGDVFWGVCNGEGQNWLGKVLMETRKKLIADN